MQRLARLQHLLQAGLGQAGSCMLQQGQSTVLELAFQCAAGLLGSSSVHLLLQQVHCRLHGCLIPAQALAQLSLHPPAGAAQPGCCLSWQQTLGCTRGVAQLQASMGIQAVPALCLGLARLCTKGSRYAYRCLCMSGCSAPFERLCLPSGQALA